MSKYLERLGEFAEGKNLIRLARPVRDRADSCCDACGSLKPRILHGLKDEQAKRYYFVGQNCLLELVKLGVISKRYGKKSGSAAFDAEMANRSEGRQDNGASKLNKQTENSSIQRVVSSVSLDGSHQKADESNGTGVQLEPALQEASRSLGSSLTGASEAGGTRFEQMGIGSLWSNGFDDAPHGHGYIGVAIVLVGWSSGGLVYDPWLPNESNEPADPATDDRNN